MKNFILGIVSTLCLAGTVAYAAESVKSRYYKVEARGTDVRVYEFNRKDGMVCVMAFANKAPVGIDCEPELEKDSLQ